MHMNLFLNDIKLVYQTGGFPSYEPPSFQGPWCGTPSWNPFAARLGSPVGMGIRSVDGHWHLKSLWDGANHCIVPFLPFFAWVKVKVKSPNLQNSPDSRLQLHETARNDKPDIFCPVWVFLQVDEASERRAPTFAQQGLRMAEAGVSLNGACLEIWGVLTNNVKIIR